MLDKKLKLDIKLCLIWISSSIKSISRLKERFEQFEHAPPRALKMVRAGFRVTHCLQIAPRAVSVGKRGEREHRRNDPIGSTKNKRPERISVRECRAGRRTTSFWNSRWRWTRRKSTRSYRRSAKRCSFTTIARCRVCTAASKRATRAAAATRARREVRGVTAAASGSAAGLYAPVRTTRRAIRNGTVLNRGTERKSTRTTRTSSSRSSYCRGIWSRKRSGGFSFHRSHRSTTSPNP